MSTIAALVVAWSQLAPSAKVHLRCVGDRAWQISVTDGALHLHLEVEEDGYERAVASAWQSTRMTVGKRLEEARARLSWSQSEVDKLTGLLAGAPA